MIQDVHWMCTTYHCVHSMCVCVKNEMIYSVYTRRYLLLRLLSSFVPFLPVVFLLSLVVVKLQPNKALPDDGDF
jgi:hypothetical protein